MPPEHRGTNAVHAGADGLTLTAGPYTAVVSPVGAALVTLTHQGRHLVRDLGRPGVPAPRFRGAVLAPWPNRIRDGHYRHLGTHHQLVVTEPERGCALHGLMLWHAWRVDHRSERELVLVDTVWPQPGYPYRVEVSAHYRLDPQTGLRIVVTARNDGADVAPFGASIHPYLTPGHGRVDEWTLTVPASTVLAVDRDRLLPMGTRNVAGTSFDFRGGRPIGPTELDHAFGDVDFAADGSARATLVAPDGAGVAMTWDRTCPWVQVHTTDHADPQVHRSGLALEPMTCAPDAFNSGVDLWHLAAGEERGAAWTIGAVSP